MMRPNVVCSPHSSEFNFDQPIDIHAAGQCLVALVHFHRNRFPGQRCQIEAGSAASHDAVRRQSFAGAKLNEIANAKSIARHHVGAAVRVQATAVGFGETAQSLDGLMRSQHAAFLEHVTDGHDDGQERRRHQVTRRPGGDQRQRNQAVGDAVQAGMAQAAPRLRKYRYGHQGCAHAGHQVGDSALLRQQKANARGDHQQTQRCQG